MIYAADLFCGAGGTSTGLARAAKARGVKVELVAVNHWPVAVETHRRNHPWARHLCADLASVEADPNRLVPGGRLDLLVASPECTHHSVARGGKPCSDQSRASAWHVLHWCERLDVAEVLVENVKEFEGWGPLGKDGRPDKARKGATFRAWVGALESLGYAVEWRVLNAADFGAATSRQRLFVRASKRGRVAWPETTHSRDGNAWKAKWKPARDAIDWTLKGESIFRRKKPLREKTLRRIESGLRKFGGEAFIAIMRGTDPKQAKSWSASVDEPLGSLTTAKNFYLCEPFVLGQQSCSAPRSVDDPLPTVATAGAIALCQPFLVQYQGGDDTKAMRTHSTDNPLPTQGCENRFGLCEPFLTKYYGAGNGAKPVTEPLDTVTTKDRFALVEPCGMDILFRMLQPHELAAAMGFGDYKFNGTKTDRVRQIGNGVAVPVAEALCGAVIDGMRKRRGRRCP